MTPSNDKDGYDDEEVIRLHPSKYISPLTTLNSLDHSKSPSKHRQYNSSTIPLANTILPQLQLQPKSRQSQQESHESISPKNGRTYAQPSITQTMSVVHSKNAFILPHVALSPSIDREEQQQRQMKSFLQNFLADDKGTFNTTIDLQRHALDTGVAVTDATVLEVVHSISPLRGLKLASCESITDAGVWAIAKKCDLLESIDLSGCLRVTDIGLRLLAHKCTLKYINLTGCVQINDSLIQALAAGCWQLRTVILKGCISISDAGIVKLAQCCKYLMHLDVSECQRIGEFGDKALLEIGTRCKHLEVLDLIGCRHVRDAGVQAIANGCPKLKTLKLTGCHDVSSCSIQSLSKLCPLLSSLSLAGCIKTTNADLNVLARNCKGLRWLDISGSSIIDASGVKALTQYCKSLSYLSLSDCPKIHDKALKALANGAPNVETLHLANCPSITEKGISALTASCTRLVNLNLTNCNQITHRYLQTLIIKLEFVEWSDKYFGFQLNPHAEILRNIKKQSIVENKSAITIQRICRGFLVRRGTNSIRYQYVISYKLPRIQALVRGWLFRCSLLRTLLIKHKKTAAKRILNAYRSFCLKRCITNRIKMRIAQRLEVNAAVIFQKRFRGHISRGRILSMRMEILRFKQLEERRSLMRGCAAMTIQRLYRGYKGREKACKLRSLLAASQLQKKRECSAAISIQRIFQGYQGRLLYRMRLQEVEKAKKRQLSAICMQSLFRGHRGRQFARIKRQEAIERRRIFAICTVQRYWRGLKQKHLSAVMIGLVLLRKRESEAAEVIQRAYKSYQSFGILKETKLALHILASKHAAATNIQACYRRYRACGELEVLKELMKLKMQAKPLFEQKQQSESHIQYLEKELEGKNLTLQRNLQDESELTLELEKTMQIKAKYHDSSRLSGTPQRYLTQYLQNQLADQLRAKRVDTALLAKNIQDIILELNTHKKQYRIVLRQLEPITHSVVLTTKRNRTKRHQSIVRMQRLAATIIQSSFRRYRVQCAMQPGMNHWLACWDENLEREYYYNAFTGVSQWHKPIGMSIFHDAFIQPTITYNDKQAKGRQVWYEAFDDTLYATYYFNVHTKEYVWTKPENKNGDVFYNDVDASARRNKWLGDHMPAGAEDDKGDKALIAQKLKGKSQLMVELGDWEQRQHCENNFIFFLHVPTSTIASSLSPRTIHKSISNIITVRDNGEGSTGAQCSGLSTARRSPQSISSQRSIKWQFRYGYEYANGQPDIVNNNRKEQNSYLVKSLNKRKIWLEIFDEASNYPCYYNQLTNEYRWEKPSDYDFSFEESSESPQNSKEWFLAAQAANITARIESTKDKDTVTMSLSSRSQKLRKLGAKWAELVDLDTGNTYYYNEITGENRWSLSPRSLNEEIITEDDNIPLSLLHRVNTLRNMSNDMYPGYETHLKWLENALHDKKWIKADAIVQQIQLREQIQSEVANTI